jgi:hypothetical protein
MPSVDVQTGTISPLNAEISLGEEFTWTCSEVPAGTSITVYAEISQGQPWFKTAAVPEVGSIQFTAPGPSEAVIAELESIGIGGGWQWTASGANVDANAHVAVHPSMPHEKKKAS